MSLYLKCFLCIHHLLRGVSSKTYSAICRCLYEFRCTNCWKGSNCKASCLVHVGIFIDSYLKLWLIQYVVQFCTQSVFFKSHARIDQIKENGNAPKNWCTDTIGQDHQLCKTSIKRFDILHDTASGVEKAGMAQKGHHIDKLCEMKSYCKIMPAAINCSHTRQITYWPNISENVPFFQFELFLDCCRHQFYWPLQCSFLLSMKRFSDG